MKHGMNGNLGGGGDGFGGGEGAGSRQEEEEGGIRLMSPVWRNQRSSSSSSRPLFFEDDFDVGSERGSYDAHTTIKECVEA